MTYKQTGNEAPRGAAVTVASTAAAGATPTKAEFDALRNDLVNLVNALRAANIVD